MTVIALFKDIQIAISDVLLTVDDCNVSTDTPTTGHTSRLKNLGLGVSRIVRKKISADGPAGRAQLLVAGTKRHIESFATILQEVFHDQRALPDELCQLVENLGALGRVQAAARLTDAEGYKEFEVIGVAGPQMCAHTFDTTGIFADVPYFGNVWIAGSGAENLLTWLQLRGEFYANNFSNYNLDERRFHVANSVTLFLMEEDTKPESRTLNTGVGGYYEAYDVSSGTLDPVDDCITIFADITGRYRDQTILVKQLMYHCYNKELLYVFAVRQEITVTAKLPVKIPLIECKLYEIPLLFPNQEQSSWTTHRVASQMLGGKNIRIVMCKMLNDIPITKRFITNEPGERLLDLTLSGQNLVVTLNPNGFAHFASRFPSDTSSAIGV